MDSLTEGPNDFWSGTYRGRHIAMLRSHSAWLVYLDRVILNHYCFETAEDAINWLRRRVDERTASTISRLPDLGEGT